MSDDQTAPTPGADEPTVADFLGQTAEQPTPEAPQPEAEQPQPDEPSKGKERLSLRFSELTKARDDARAETEYWRREAERTRHQPQPPSAVPSDGAPDPSQYEHGEYDPRYVQDSIQFGVRQALVEEREQDAKRTAQQTYQSKAQSLAAKLIDSGLEGAVLIGSGGDVPFSQSMVEALAENEQAPVIADYLGRNRKEAERIAALSPMQQGYELAKLEGRLASQAKPSNAPPPVPTVGSRGVASPGQRDDMPIDDWMRLERERSRAR